MSRATAARIITAGFAIALAVGLLGTACGNDDKGTTIIPSEQQETVATEPPGETGTPTLPPDENETELPGIPAGDPSAGSEVFASAGCGGCHTLQAAGSEGTVGPDLDELEPEYDDAVEQITEGGGGMPAFRDDLTRKQIEDVAAFVVESTKG
jgi:mono/diheme cytochrome c family protein